MTNCHVSWDTLYKKFKTYSIFSVSLQIKEIWLKTFESYVQFKLWHMHVQSVKCLVLKFGLHLPGREGAQSPWFLDPVGSTISRNMQFLPGYTWRVGQLIQVYNYIKGLFRYLDHGGGNKYWQNIHYKSMVFYPLLVVNRVSNASGFYLRAIATCEPCNLLKIWEQLRTILRICAQRNCDRKPIVVNAWEDSTNV